MHYLRRSIITIFVLSDLKNLRETHNCNMRWETARQKESKSPALDRAGDLSGHSYPCGSHNRGTAICKMNLKSEAELTSADVDKVMPR